jgi:APA family basic amino acid/polyamine antiporter
VAEQISPTEIRFSREVDSVRATSRALAILMAAAVFTLHGPVLAAAGPASTLAYLLMGVVFLLTLVCYVELLLNSGREGSAYDLLREATTGPLAFLCGWCVLLGGLLLCAVLALGFASGVSGVSEAYLGVQLPTPIIAAGLVLGMALYNILRGRGLRRARDAVTWGVVSTLVLVCLVCLARAQLDNYRPFSPHGALGIQGALSLLLIGFLAFESAPLTFAEIREPRRAIPRALLATLCVGTVLGMMVSLVVVGSVASSEWSGSGIPMAAMVQQCVGRHAGLLVLVIALVFIPLALNSTVLFVLRQAESMDQDDLLPSVLRRRGTRFGTPYVLLLLIGAGGAVLCLLGDLEAVARLGGFCALVVMSSIALGDVLRQRSLEDTPVFRLPLWPLIPALALVVNLFFLPTLGVAPLLAGAAWLVAGMVIYFTYAKDRYIAAQEGVVVFRRKRKPVEAEYRVLVPLELGREHSQLIRLAIAMAGDKGGEVVPLRVVTLPAQVPLREGSRMAEGIESLFTWSLAAEDTGSVSLAPVTRVARSVSQGILDAAVEEKCDLILLSWEGYSKAQGRVMGRVLDPVVENAPCDVVLVKGDELSTVAKILVPTSGGPHAPIAARVALKLARLYGAQVTALYVCREGATAEDRQHGLEMIAQTMKGLEADGLVRPKVITASGVVSGILAEAEEHDLMLLGASGEGLFDRFLFGTIPERIAARSPVPVMIARQRAPLGEFWLRRVWGLLYRLFPTLEAEERSTVYRQIREGARADIDFYVMMSLSATIATLGLLLNSAAVIIGGMLVAPLMSPMIGIALAIALGNIRLLRDAGESAIKGIFAAVVVALVLASALPFRSVGGEILARTSPNLLDLLIALASGAAGAYAVSRKDVSAALPGVAIAAALVPPLGVVGVGLAGRQIAVAGGGLLLFGTNLVGITLAGGVTFLLLGFRPARGVRERESNLRRGLVVSMLLLLVLSLPLAFVSGRTVQATQEREVITRAAGREIDALAGVSLVDVDLEQRGQITTVTVTVYAAQPLEEGAAEHLNEAISQELGQPVSLRLIAIPVSETTVP